MVIIMNNCKIDLVVILQLFFKFILLQIVFMKHIDQNLLKFCPYILLQFSNVLVFILLIIYIEKHLLIFILVMVYPEHLSGLRLWPFNLFFPLLKALVCAETNFDSIASNILT